MASSVARAPVYGFEATQDPRRPGSAPPRAGGQGKELIRVVGLYEHKRTQNRASQRGEGRGMRQSEASRAELVEPDRNPARTKQRVHYAQNLSFGSKLRSNHAPFQTSKRYVERSSKPHERAELNLDVNSNLSQDTDKYWRYDSDIFLTPSISDDASSESSTSLNSQRQRARYRNVDNNSANENVLGSYFQTIHKATPKPALPPLPLFKRSTSLVDHPCYLEAEASTDHCPSDSDNQMRLFEGDIIVVYSRDSNGFCYGKNLRSGGKAWFSENHVVFRSVSTLEKILARYIVGDSGVSLEDAFNAAGNSRTSEIKKLFDYLDNRIDELHSCIEALPEEYVLTKDDYELLQIDRARSNKASSVSKALLRFSNRHPYHPTWDRTSEIHSRRFEEWKAIFKPQSSLNVILPDPITPHTPTNFDPTFLGTHVNGPFDKTPRAMPVAAGSSMSAVSIGEGLSRGSTPTVRAYNPSQGSFRGPSPSMVAMTKITSKSSITKDGTKAQMEDQSQLHIPESRRAQDHGGETEQPIYISKANEHDVRGSHSGAGRDIFTDRQEEPVGSHRQQPGSSLGLQPSLMGKGRESAKYNEGSSFKPIVVAEYPRRVDHPNKSRHSPNKAVNTIFSDALLNTNERANQERLTKPNARNGERRVSNPDDVIIESQALVDRPPLRETTHEKTTTNAIYVDLPTENPQFPSSPSQKYKPPPESLARRPLLSDDLAVPFIQQAKQIVVYDVSALPPHYPSRDIDSEVVVIDCIGVPGNEDVSLLEEQELHPTKVNGRSSGSSKNATSATPSISSDIDDKYHKDVSDEKDIKSQSPTFRRKTHSRRISDLPTLAEE
ncbi:hypothetical protein CC78DRAFT_549261 [Lojkania enalia]|uniref:SH3 domain-containing protein n=1 Tax=Lojkania enalia TaxID=147567 RepID=A0A9P4K071_9PLEO|nr:hypothetical protein CC78DRAFT_549261 [Didymosphaeria enalia]